MDGTQQQMTPAKRELMALKNKVQELESKLGRAQLAVPEDVKKPMYDGTSDFQHFLKLFNVYATAHSWTYSDCAKMFPLYLEGEAREIYLGLETGQKDTWKALTDSMAAQTQKFDPQGSALRKLTNMKMRPNEPIVIYGSKIRELVDQAFPEGNYGYQAREEQAVHYFMQGLPIFMKKKLFFMKRPEDLRKAMAAAKRVMEVKEELEEEEMSRAAALEMEELKQQVNAIEKRVDEEQKEDEWQQGRRWNKRGRERRGKWQPEYFNPNWTQFGVENGEWSGADNSWENEEEWHEENNTEEYGEDEEYPEESFQVNLIGASSSGSSRRPTTPTLNFLTIATIFALFLFLAGTGSARGAVSGLIASAQLPAAGLNPNVSGKVHPNFSNSGSEPRQNAKWTDISAHGREAGAQCFPVGRWKPCQTELNEDVQQKKERKAEEMRSEEEEEKTNDENPKKAEEEEMKKEADEENKAEEENTDEAKKAEDAKQAEEPINAEERKAEDEEEKAEEKKADEPKKAEEKKTEEEGRAEEIGRDPRTNRKMREEDDGNSQLSAVSRIHVHLAKFNAQTIVEDL